MTNSRTRLAAAAPLLAIAVAACGGGDDGGPVTPPEPPRPATITVTPSEASLNYISQSTTFSAVVRDQYGAAMSATVAWSSSDEAVFTVDARGRVTAVGNGSGTVEASVAAAGLTGAASVVVQQQAAAISVVSGDKQEGLRSTKLPDPVVVKLEDRGGHGVVGTEITFAPGPESGSVSASSVTSDEMGEGATEWTLGTKFGAQTLVITVAGGIQNRASATATSENPLPDLAVETVVLSRDDLTDLEMVDVAATVANRGDAAGPDSFRVELRLDGAVLDSATVQRLEPDATAELSFAAAGPFEAGQRSLQVVADPGGGLDEWGKANNTNTRALDVAAQPKIAPGHASAISGTTDDVLLFRIDVEEGSKDALNVEVAGGAGDPDLFVNFGSRPDHHYKYSCISGNQPGDAELCQFLPARAGSYHVAVHAFTTFGPLELKVTVGGKEVETFDIDLVFVQRGSAEQNKVVEDAVKRWESTIVQGVGNIDFAENPIGAGQCGAGSPIVNDVVDDIRMFVVIDSIDGPGGILGRAGPCSVRVTRFTGYPDIPGPPIAGSMEFDEDDLPRLSAQGILASTVLHEIGHVLGFGTLWDRFDLLENPSVNSNPNNDTHFTGQLALAAFEAAGGRNYRGGAKVPVENGGSAGSADSHWRESVFENELMTPFLSEGVEPFSLITIESMADMGYSVDISVADRYRVTGGDISGKAIDPEAVADLRGDIADYPIMVIDQKGRVVRVERPRGR